MNNIPTELLDKWLEDAGIAYPYSFDLPCNNYTQGIRRNSYIAGRQDQYLSMQDEIERLKGLIGKAYDTGYIEHTYSSSLPFGKRVTSKREVLADFLKQHNL